MRSETGESLIDLAVVSTVGKKAFLSLPFATNQNNCSVNNMFFINRVDLREGGTDLFGNLM